MINKLVEQADQLAARGQREQARDLYVRVCQLAPHRCRYWLRLAELQNDLDQVGDCLKALEYALRLEPRNRDALLLAAGVLQKAGDFEQAVQRADQVLDLEGGNRLAALLNKGTALLPMARYAEALAAADAALNIDPRQPVAHSTRGSALFGLGRLEEAQAAFDQALTLRPGHGLVLINRAAVLRALRRPAEALADVDAALAVQPDFPAALLNRAAALMDLERYAEALATLDRLLARHPKHVKALRNRSLALIQMGRYPAAMTTVQSLQALGQSVVEIVLSASKALLGQTQPAQALAWIDQALVWHPDHPELLRARIAVLLAQEHYRTALVVAERLLAVTPPDQVVARVAVAAVFNANGRFQESLALLDQLPPAAREDWQFHVKRGEALALLDRSEEARVAFATADQADPRAFRAAYYDGPFQIRPADSLPPPVTPELVRVNFEFRRLEHADWQDYDNRVAMIQRLTGECLARGEPSPLLPFRSLLLPLSPALRLAIARREAEWVRELIAGQKASDIAVRSSLPSEAELGARADAARLKIGYVSADFREHPTAHLMRSLFRSHDRQRFEIYAYSLRGDDGSAYYRQIRDDSEHFTDLSPMENAAAAQRIREDGIDILVDLMAYTNFARTEIFALRPAPVQVNWLGFPGSSGADFIDYLLADPVVLPPDQAAFCSEQPAWLPECYQVNDRWQEIAETGARRADHGLPEQGFVFCSFNQIQKLEPVMFAAWMRILDRVPGSVLWLYSKSEEAPDYLRATAAAHGIAGERLIFAGRLPKAEHLERHRLADLFLDTRIYNAHTTASDALWAGVPVLTCMGEAFPARVAASLLHAVGLPELITHSLDEYEHLAVRLATRPEELAALKEKLAANRLREPLFDTERFTRHLERAYEMMWERHAKGLPPVPLQVPPLPPSVA